MGGEPVKYGTSMQKTGRIAPIRRSLVNSIAPEPLQRKKLSQREIEAGYIKWLDNRGRTPSDISRMLGLDYSFVYQVVMMYQWRKAVATKPPQEALKWGSL